MRLLSRQRAVGSAIVSNPGRETTSPTSPALAWAVRLRCSKALAWRSQQTAHPQGDNISNINGLCCLCRQIGVCVS